MRKVRKLLTALLSSGESAPPGTTGRRALTLEELEPRLLLSADAQAPLHAVGLHLIPHAAAQWQDMHESTIARTERIALATRTLAMSANPPPAISVPAAGLTSQSTPTVFSTANGNPITVSDAAVGTGNVQVTIGAADFQQGFETGNAGFNMSSVEPGVFTSKSDATVVPSGTNGITARSGGSFALAAQNLLSAGGSAFTPFAASRAAGYSTTFPAGGFSTSIDIYLDPNGGNANGTQFDYTVAISGTTVDSHGLPVSRRDFVFNVGFYNDTDFTGSGNRIVIAGSNNAGPGIGPRNPVNDPFTVTTAGWYTFEHRFYAKGNGVLAVQLTLKDAGGNTLHSWTRSDPTDIIGSTVGGSRYGWFALQQFPWVAFDNVTKTSAASGTLTLGTTAGLTFSQGTGTGDSLMTFTGTLANVNAALNGLVYQPATGYTGLTALSVIANDLGIGVPGAAQAAFGAVPISVVVPTAPLIATTGTTLTFVRNAPATAADAQLTVNDAESYNLIGATVSLTGNYASGQDALGFVDQNGITGSWDPKTGVLTLSGRASVADYQAALRSVTYINSSASPSTLPRTVSFVVDDGTLKSAAAVRGIDVIEPPVASADSFVAGSGAPLLIAQTALTANDLNFDGGALSIVSVTPPAHGTLQADPDGGYTYLPTAGFVGRDTFSYVVADPRGLQATATVTVVVIRTLPLPNSGDSWPGNSSIPTPAALGSPPAGVTAPTAAPARQAAAAERPGPAISASTDQPLSRLDGGPVAASVREPVPRDGALHNGLAQGSGDPDPHAVVPPGLMAKSFFDNLPDRQTFLGINGAPTGPRHASLASLWSALDEFRREIDRSTAIDDAHHKMLTQLITGGGLALSAGLVSWMLRGGALAASLLAALPSWTLFDPIPILAARRSAHERRGAEEEPLDQRTEQAVAGVFRSQDRSNRSKHGD